MADLSHDMSTDEPLSSPALGWPQLPLIEEEAMPVLREAFAAHAPAAPTSPAEQPAAPTGLPATGEPLIVARDVRFGYTRGVPVLHGINVTFSRGEFTAIIGNNGSGKSTLMKLILGLLKPSDGSVTIGGLDTRRARVSDLARRIGFIFQEPNDQLFANSVIDEIRFGLRNLGLPEDEITARSEAAIEQFGLAAVRDTFPRFLARGDKQKLCIAAIVAMRPDVLLLDEPTTGQDHRDARQIMELAQALNAQGITILSRRQRFPPQSQPVPGEKQSIGARPGQKSLIFGSSCTPSVLIPDFDMQHRRIATHVPCSERNVAVTRETPTRFTACPPLIN